MSFTVGSLFSGIGGFDLGLERAGMRTVWFCEQDEFCRRVLARHWPGVPCHPDVRALVADAGSRRYGGRTESPRGDDQPTNGHQVRRIEAASRTTASSGARRDDGLLPVPVPYVDVLCGGFPCQDISLAGRGAGLAGERSGLWREFARLIGELRPRYVLVENVPALTSRGLDVVLADLAARGFDAEWDHLPASAFGAPHRRDRIWLVAYPNADGRRLEERPQLNGGAAQDPADRHSRRRHTDGSRHEVADPARHGAEEQAPAGTVGQRARASSKRSGARMANADGATGNGTRPAGEALPRSSTVERPGRRGSGEWHPWLAEPDVGRVAHGVPARVDRLRALGNSLVPQIAEWIGRRLIEWEAANAVDVD